MNEHALHHKDKIDLKDMFGRLVKHKKKILFFMLLFGVLTACYAYLTPNTYSTSTTIEIDDQQRGSMGSEDMLKMAMKPDKTNTDTEIEIIKSRYLIAKALKEVDFTHRYYAKYRFKEREIYVNSPFEVVLERGKSLSFNIFPVNAQHYRLEVEGVDPVSLKKWQMKKVFAYGESVDEKYFDFTLYLKENRVLNKDTAYRFVVIKKQKAIREIQNNILVVQTMSQSRVLKITYTDSVALRAQQFADALAEAYLLQEIQRKTEESSMILAFIDKQLAGINTNLEDSENNLENFKKKSNMVSLGTKAESMVDKLNEYEGKLSEANMEEQMLDTLYKQVIKGKNLESISTVGLDLAGTGVPVLVQKLQEAMLKRKILRADYTAEHPAVKKLSQSIKQSKKIIASTIKTLKLRISKRKGLLKKTIKEYNALMESLPEKEKIFGGLQRKFVVNKKIYSYLLEKRATTAIEKASTVNKSHIIDTALIPENPIKPNRNLIVLVGLTVGLIFGIAFAFLLEFMDDRVKEEEDIRKRSSLSLLGSIPFIKNEKNDIKVFVSPKSVVAEAFRALRTNLQFMSQKDNTTLITVTSTIGSEGKSTVATNLASIISLTGKKTIILNMDMRKPRLHEKFNVPNNQGMSTLLAGRVTLEEVIQETKYDNLHLISSGPIPPNPSELIGSNALLKIIEELKSVYDTIIFDTPPVGVVTDAMTLMRLSDISLYVLRAQYSKKSYLADIQRMAQDHKIDNVSLLLNGVKATKNGYGYGYGFGYGYYEEDK